MNLDDFERQLLEVIDRPASVRPFVCDGSPLDCRIFIVGANPATEMAGDFWDFWESGYGFRKEAWSEAYAAQRLARGKRALSNTRRVLDRIAASTSAACLETNVFATPTELTAHLPSSARRTDPLDFLLDAVQPAAVVAHGEEARRHLEARFGARIPMGALAEADAPWGAVLVRGERHFARGYGYTEAESLGSDLERVVGAV